MPIKEAPSKATKKVTKKKVAKKKAVRKVQSSPKKGNIATEDIQKAVATVAAKKKVAKKKVVKKKAAPKVRKPRKRGQYYIDRKELLAEVIASKAVGRMSDRLAAMLSLLTEKYAKKSNFARYTYNDDMQGYARMMLVKSWQAFKPEKSDNPFAFYTQCIKNSFKQFLNQEKKQRNIRDELLVDKGLNPSYTYSLEYEDKQRQALHEEEAMPVVEISIDELDTV